MKATTDPLQDPTETKMWEALPPAVSLSPPSSSQLRSPTTASSSDGYEQPDDSFSSAWFSLSLLPPPFAGEPSRKKFARRRTTISSPDADLAVDLVKLGSGKSADLVKLGGERGMVGLGEEVGGEGGGRRPSRTFRESGIPLGIRTVIKPLESKSKKVSESSSMASSDRSTTPHVTFDSQQPVLDAVPLSTVAFSGHPTSTNNHAAASQTSELIGNLQGSYDAGVVLSASAAMEKIGPIVGSVNIGECGDGYSFHVALPGVSTHYDDFTMQIERNGKVTVEGNTTTGEKMVNKNHHKFEMLSENLCPPGNFSVSFKLPGPVNNLQCYNYLGVGELFGFVRKAENSVV